jgi:tetratricopeptide (TPR) repeat protein
MPGYGETVARRIGKQGRFEEAVADLTRAIELVPQHAGAFRNRGETYRQQGYIEESLADFARAIELDPKNAWILASRGETYRQQGRFEEALADLTRAIELDPNYAWAFGSRDLSLLPRLPIRSVEALSSTTIRTEA